MNAQTYEDFLRGQAEKAQYGVVIIPARTALDMADFIEMMRGGQGEKAQLSVEDATSDCISRRGAIDAAKHAWAKGLEPSQYIEELPSAQSQYEELTPEEAASEIASGSITSAWHWLDDMIRLKQMGYAICRKR